jgi:hypothetical protein
MLCHVLALPSVAKEQDCCTTSPHKYNSNNLGEGHNFDKNQSSCPQWCLAHILLSPP